MLLIDKDGKKEIMDIGNTFEIKVETRQNNLYTKQFSNISRINL
jgi:hypothetical protein